MSDNNFKENLRKSIINADEKLDRIELLTDIFKTFVAKTFQTVMEKTSMEDEGRLEMDVLVMAKRDLINEFRGASLGEYQQSVSWYEKLFQSTLEEIFNDASLAHGGQDKISMGKQNLEIDQRAYVNEGGLYVPEGMKK